MTARKRVLVITYYWPPAGGSGVQRWLKFVKYLREFGWEPIVYTPSNPEMPVVDQSLLSDLPKGLEVIQTPIWEPYDFYRKFTGKKGTIGAGFASEEKGAKKKHGFSVWVRGNFFIPDARKFWIKSSVRFLTDYLKKNPVDALVSTGPPHSMHKIALGVKEKTNIPWLADFRDPWTQIDFYHELKLTRWADARHRRMELQVLRAADRVVSVGKVMSDGMEAILKKSGAAYAAEKFQVITNGYDDADFVQQTIALDKKFSIAHLGTMAASRNPETLWEVLAQLCNEVPEFGRDLEIKLVGKVDFSIVDALKAKKLAQYLNKIDYVPQKEVVLHQQQAQVLLLVLNDTPNARGILTGKFFEYLSAKRPILAVGPTDGDVGLILHETQAGVIANYGDAALMKATLLDWYKDYQAERLAIASSGVEIYTRKALTGKMAGVLGGMIGGD